MATRRTKTKRGSKAGKPAPKRRGPRAAPRLLADIGGTAVRFALQRPGRPPGPSAHYAVARYPRFEDAVAHFLAQSKEARPAEAVLAVAAPIAGDSITLTNGPWTFSARALRRRFGWRRLRVVNDFAALARALPLLRPRDLLKIGGGARVKGAPMIAIGPGTGLGAAALVFGPGGPIPLAGEGGHATLAPADERESAVVAALRRRFGHVSAERAVSGPGLVNLLAAVCEIEGVTPPRATPEGIARRALDGSSPFCAEALAMFCAMLGTAAADLALAFGAKGGVFIGGGILRRYRRYFADSPFRTRFESKGRYSAYLAAIPTYLILREDAALLGAAALADEAPTPR